MKFKLITYIDRINFFSEKFISFYLKTFNFDEFHFLIHHKNFNQLTEYLNSKGFSSLNYEKLERNRFGFGENINKQNQIKSHFLKLGFIVVYADIDELIYHPDLKNYILNSHDELYCPLGITITQNLDESKIDIGKNILEQRTKFFFNQEWYSKVCILKKDFIWDMGRHNKKGVKIDENIFLFDIGKICIESYLENNFKTLEIYDLVNSRYKEKNKILIQEKFDGWLKKSKDIKYIISDFNII